MPIGRKIVVTDTKTGEEIPNIKAMTLHLSPCEVNTAIVSIVPMENGNVVLDENGNLLEQEETALVSEVDLVAFQELLNSDLRNELGEVAYMEYDRRFKPGALWKDLPEQTREEYRTIASAAVSAFCSVLLYRRMAKRPPETIDFIKTLLKDVIGE